MAISNPQRLVAALPPRPGVYRFQSAGGKALYVGKAANLKKRVNSYFQKTRQSPRIALMLAAAAAVETIITASAAEALLLENNLIKSLRPKYNILFRDDKTYPFLQITKHAYPRIMFYRGPALPDADAFGPFPDSGAVRETIDILQRVFLLRTCGDAAMATRSRPCLLHGIGRCSAPCVNKIAPADYNADVRQAKRLLAGGASPVADAMRQKMEDEAAAQRYENAARLRDRLRALSVVRGRHFAEDAETPNADYVGVAVDGARACVNVVMVRGGRRIGERRLFPQNGDGDDDEILRAFLAQHYRRQAPDKIFVAAPPADWQDAAPQLPAGAVVKAAGDARRRVQAAGENARHALAMRKLQQAAGTARLHALQRRLNLPRPPRRLECFDISHSMGEETIAARVVFVDGAPLPRDYRLYRIKTAAGGDDCAAMREAVARCYRRARDENKPPPDVLFIDGGGAQVKAAADALATTLNGDAPPPVFGIAKGEKRRAGEETLIAADGEIMRLAPADAALHLMQAVRDEAHRFAGKGHRRRRDKKRGDSSALDGIRGLGREKRKTLIAMFGGLAPLQSASAAELIKISGIGPRLAERIYQALHR